MTAKNISRRLAGRRSGDGYVACCPAHDDKTPSLSVTHASNGRILVKCHAGCTQEAVIAALRQRDLWPGSNGADRRAIVATYDYTNERGQLLYQVVRTDPKGFFQRRPDGHGGWINKKGERQVLYRIREVLDAPIVFLVEGEKDAECLRAHGFVATTNAGGAKARWLAEYTQAFRGREVIIVPDNDRPGWQRARVIAEALLGTAARIRVFDLPNGTKDISDWLAVGHSEHELIATLEGLDAI